MKSTSLQIRKMNLIEYLLNVQDEKAFSKIEENIQKSIKAIKPQDIVFTKSELIKRAIFSDNQITKAQVLSQKEVENLSKNW